MKPKNFPGRKLQRQLVAKGENVNTDRNVAALQQAKGIRTKKHRAAK